MTSIATLDTLPPPPDGRAGWPWTEADSQTLWTDAPPGGWPKISVVCPSFNQGAFIEETIRSVLLQGYPATEFIVTDGGSTDETLQILERYSPWIAHWESERDRGQSHAINKGFDRAGGDLFGWINSDDYYLPGAFAVLARAYRANPRRIFFGDWAERRGGTETITHHRDRPAFAFEVSSGARHLQSHTVFWPRAAHQRINEKLRFTMDADLFKRLTASGLRPHYLAYPIAVYRHHPATKTATIIDVAREETDVWSRNQPWHTYWRWRAARWVDGIRRRLPRRR